MVTVHGGGGVGGGVGGGGLGGITPNMRQEEFLSGPIALFSQQEGSLLPVFGLLHSVLLPSTARIGLYDQPAHPALALHAL